MPDLKQRQPRRRRRVPAPASPPDPNALAWSIPAFCKLHGFSDRQYLRLRAQGRAPDEMRLGHRVLITREAAARWRVEREGETATKR
jgi:hypothetical protein